MKSSLICIAFSIIKTISENLEVFFDLDNRNTENPTALKVYITDQPIPIIRNDKIRLESNYNKENCYEGLKLGQVTRIYLNNVYFKQGYYREASFRKQKLSKYDFDPLVGDKIAYSKGRSAHVGKVNIVEYVNRPTEKLRKHLLHLKYTLKSVSGTEAFTELTTLPYLWGYLAHASSNHQNGEISLLHLQCLNLMMDFAHSRAKLLHPILQKTFEANFVQNVIELEREEKVQQGNVEEKHHTLNVKYVILMKHM